MTYSTSADWSTVSGNQYGFAFTLGDATSGITRAFYIIMNHLELIVLDISLIYHPKFSSNDFFKSWRGS
jgi:hypothetical protein